MLNPMWIPIAVGGVLGTLARYEMQQLLPLRSPTSFPTGTLLVNLAGSLVLGLVMGYAAGTDTLDPRLRAALSVGFCGAFTTMSTFGFETTTLLGAGQLGRAGAYVVATVVGSIAAAALGFVVMQRMT